MHATAYAKKRCNASLDLPTLNTSLAFLYVLTLCVLYLIQEHLPCLEDSCATASGSAKGDDYCNICFVDGLKAGMA